MAKNYSEESKKFVLDNINQKHSKQFQPEYISIVEIFHPCE